MRKRNAFRGGQVWWVSGTSSLGDRPVLRTGEEECLVRMTIGTMDEMLSWLDVGGGGWGEERGRGGGARGGGSRRMKIEVNDREEWGVLRRWRKLKEMEDWGWMAQRVNLIQINYMLTTKWGKLRQTDTNKRIEKRGSTESEPAVTTAMLGTERGGTDMQTDRQISRHTITYHRDRKTDTGLKALLMNKYVTNEGFIFLQIKEI